MKNQLLLTGLMSIVAFSPHATHPFPFDDIFTEGNKAELAALIYQSTKSIKEVAVPAGRALLQVAKDGANAIAKPIYQQGFEEGVKHANSSTFNYAKIALVGLALYYAAPYIEKGLEEIEKTVEKERTLSIELPTKIMH